MTKDGCCEEAPGAAAKDVWVEFGDGCVPAGWDSGTDETTEAIDTDCCPCVPGVTTGGFAAVLLLLEWLFCAALSCELVACVGAAAVANPLLGLDTSVACCCCFCCSNIACSFATFSFISFGIFNSPNVLSCVTHPWRSSHARMSRYALRWSLDGIRHENGLGRDDKLDSILGREGKVGNFRE